MDLHHVWAYAGPVSKYTGHKPRTDASASMHLHHAASMLPAPTQPKKLMTVLAVSFWLLVFV